MTMKIHGLGKINKNLMKLAKVADDPKMLEALVKDAEGLRDAMKLYVPVKTGRLRRSIVAKKFRTQRIGNPAAFVAIDRNPKTGAPHAHLVEYGTSRAPAEPFFRPVVKAFRKFAKTESAIKKLLREIK